MAHYVDREPRQDVCLDARLHSEAGWTNAVIANVSSHGMMIRTEPPPGRRSYVEVCRRKLCMVGWVMWSGDAWCGIVLREAVDIGTLLQGGPARVRRACEERRSVPRVGKSP